jgi:hypothetical protein
MGMPCQVNSILKLNPEQYPAQCEKGITYVATKEGYRILPMDVPIPLVNDDWMSYAEVIITQLSWAQKKTHLEFRIARIYSSPFPMKE